MDLEEFRRLAERDHIHTPRCKEMVRALLVEKLPGSEIADRYGVTTQRVYQLRKEFLEASASTPLDWLAHEIMPIMRRIGVKARHCNKIRDFILSLK